MAQQDKLAAFLRELLSGTVDIGVTMIPLIGLFKQAKTDPAWKQAGIVEWLTSDPQAAPLLAEALEKARDRIPIQARASLILALGGTIQ